MTWAFEILRSLGFQYDSSVYPIRGRRYGDATAPRTPFVVSVPSGSVIEIPPATVRVLGRTWPVCGGGYLRHFPYFINRWALARINRIHSAVVYMHPYEIELNRPRRADAGFSTKKKAQYRLFTYLQYRNRGTMQSKIDRLLREFRFGRIVDVYADQLQIRPQVYVP